MTSNTVKDVKTVDEGNPGDEEILILSQGSEMSTESGDRVTVNIGTIIKPNILNSVVEKTKGPSSEQGPMGKKPQRRNRSGSEKRRRRRAKAGTDRQLNWTNKDTNATGTNKRNRSPAIGGNGTPPSKRPQQENHGTTPGAPSYKGALMDSMTYMIIGANETALRGDQVEQIMRNIVWELENFIGSSTKAPSFNGRRLGEHELELRCADERTVSWLQGIVPKLKPWRGASLELVTKARWTELNNLKKKVRMSVLVPWRTSGTYFLDVLRSHNPELKTRNWEIKGMQDRGEATLFYLRVDEVSANVLQSRNYRAHWLLDSIEFRLERQRKSTQTLQNLEKDNEVETVSVQDKRQTDSRGLILNKKGTPATNTDLNRAGATSATTSSNSGTTEATLTGTSEGASNVHKQTKTGPHGRASQVIRDGRTKTRNGTGSTSVDQPKTQK